MTINVTADVTWSGNDVFQSTSFNIPRPASGISVGMFLTLGVSLANNQSAGTVTVTGWTSIGTTNGSGAGGSDIKKWVFYRIADATDAAGGGNWVCNCADGFIEQWAGAGWNGVDTTTPFAVGPSINLSDSTTFSWNSITSPGTGSVWVGVLVLANNSGSKTDPTPPPANQIESTSGFYFGPATIYSAQVNSGSFAPTGSEGAAWEWVTVAIFLNPASVGGIAFDATANSGDQAAASSYSGSASWSGVNRLLAVDVSLLGAGTTVTAMTYGGAACTKVGSRATVTSLGGVECWEIISSDPGAPGTGSNTLAVTLSGSIEFTVEWTSYTGVNQFSPVEAFNSAQATNTGSATDASVAITTVADNDWVHAAVVANDTSITAGNTTRNNVSGTLGSGANEDNGAAKTPAGSVTMSYTGMGITTTWAIAGYGIRPLAAASLIPFGIMLS